MACLLAGVAAFLFCYLEDAWPASLEYPALELSGTRSPASLAEREAGLPCLQKYPGSQDSVLSVKRVFLFSILSVFFFKLTNLSKLLESLDDCSRDLCFAFLSLPLSPPNLLPPSPSLPPSFPTFLLFSLPESLYVTMAVLELVM